MEILEPKKFCRFHECVSSQNYQQMATENSFGLTHAMRGGSVPARAIAEDERRTLEDSTVFASGDKEIGH